MKTEDCESWLSKRLSKAVEYFKDTNLTGFASLLTSATWIGCGVGVFLGFSPLRAVVVMFGSYAIMRIASHFDESSDENLKTGVYREIKTHNQNHNQEPFVCVNCVEKRYNGMLSISYKVYYLFNYELARSEQTRNFECDRCRQQTESQGVEVATETE